MKDCKDCVYCIRYTDETAQCICAWIPAWFMDRTDAETCPCYEEESWLNDNE